MTFTPCVDKWMLEQLWQYVRDDWTKRHILGNLFCLAAAWIKWVDISTCQFFTPLVAVWDLGSHWLSLSLVCGIWFWWEFMESFGEIQSKSFCTDIFLALGPGCGLIPACYLCWSLVFVWPYYSNSLIISLAPSGLFALMFMFPVGFSHLGIEHLSVTGWISNHSSLCRW
jgi:hypothetical protein